VRLWLSGVRCGTAAASGPLDYIRHTTATMRNVRTSFGLFALFILNFSCLYKLVFDLDTQTPQFNSVFLTAFLDDIGLFRNLVNRSMRTVELPVPILWLTSTPLSIGWNSSLS
jgi:hypothetical protein